MKHHTLEQRAKHGRTPPGEIHRARARHLTLKLALCMLGLGAVLSACSSSPDASPDGDGNGDADEVRTVSFDKNGGDTEAVPSSMTLQPPATTVAHLPEPPTRAGHTFVGWNTESGGNGSPFTTGTTVPADTPFVVYAQWVPSLAVQLSSDVSMLTPIEGERSAVFTVTVAGFHNEADASYVKLSIGLEDAEGLLLQNVVSSYTPSSQTARFTVEYDGLTPFSEGFATVYFNLENMPKGYEYVGGTQTLRVDIADGLENTRPIPVNEDNIQRFNAYADTSEGLKRHYKLTENVALTPPAAQGSNWAVIGIFSTDLKNRRPFTGSFDGGGNTISGLSIYAAVGSTDDNGKAMFGYIGPGAVVKNLGLEGGSVAGNNQIGILVGRNRGTVQDCYATGSVTGQDFLGGLVGWNEGTVKGSYAKAGVRGRDGVGGLVGRNANSPDNTVATVHNSYATGDATGSGNGVGGLVGMNLATVHNSYATGDATGTGNVGGTGNSVGGLVGASSGTVQDSYATGSVTGNSNVGGLVGESSGSNATVQDSVALNPSVIATGSNIGRVVGNNAGSASLSGNHANDDMELELAGAPYEPTVDTAQADEKDGEGTDAFTTWGFWAGLSSWDFSATGVWEWREGFLPTLRGVGGE